MAQNDTESGEAQTYELGVDRETVIQGLKINDRPGERRVVLFRPKAGGGYGEGTIRDVRGLRWDGDAPPQLRPQEFLSEPVESPQEARAEARRIAEEEGDDPDQAADVAMDVWEDQARAFLQEEIVVEPRVPEETKTVYRIDYDG